MENYRRTINIEDIRLKKYVLIRDEYLEEVQPLNKQIQDNNAEMQEAMDKAKEIIERVKEENEKLNAKVVKKAESFMKKKEQIQTIMEELQTKERNHKYEYLEAVEIVDGELQGTMVDALEKAQKDVMDQFDNLS